MKKKIMVYAYLLNNFGDDLFIKILLERYPNTNFKFILNKSYKKTLKNYNNWHPIYTSNVLFKVFRKILNSLNKMDLLYKTLSSDCIANLFIGGSLFVENKNSLEQIKYYNDIISNNRKSFLCGANFGPYKTEFFKKSFEEYLCNFTDVCFRDMYSYNLFKNNKKIRVATDIVFNLNVDGAKISTDGYVAISVIDCKKRFDKNICNIYEEKIVDFIEYFSKKNLKIKLMSFCKEEGDEEAIESILNRIKKRNKDLLNFVSTYFYSNNIDECLDIIAKSNAVVGTRFHANILGIIYDKPIIPIAYNNKIINTLNDLKYAGKIINIEEIKEFDVFAHDYSNCKCKIDVNEQRKNATEHFKEFDKFVSGMNNYGKN